jgi:hypothetical protein
MSSKITSYLRRKPRRQGILNRPWHHSRCHPSQSQVRYLVNLVAITTKTHFTPVLEPLPDIRAYSIKERDEEPPAQVSKTLKFKAAKPPSEFELHEAL